MTAPRSRRGRPPVAGEDVWSRERATRLLRPRARLAARSTRQSAPTRPAAACRPYRAALAVVGIADVHERLGHAVALENRVAELLPELLEHVRRRAAPNQRRTGASAVPILAAASADHAEQPDVNRRDAEEQRRLERVEFVSGCGAVKAFEQAHPAAGCAASSTARCQVRARETTATAAGSDRRS